MIKCVGKYYIIFEHHFFHHLTHHLIDHLIDHLIAHPLLQPMWRTDIKQVTSADR